MPPRSALAEPPEVLLADASAERVGFHLEEVFGEVLLLSLVHELQPRLLEQP